MSLAPSPSQVRRLWPVVISGRVLAMVLGMVSLVGGIAVWELLMGGAAQAPFGTVIISTMILISLCSSDLVAAMRATGELELAVTLANPGRVLIHRIAPVLALVSGQMVLVGLAMMPFVPAWQVLIGWAFSVLPLAVATAISLYWNLRSKSAGGVLGAGLLTLLPVLIWVGSAEMFPHYDNLRDMSKGEIIWSAIRCQLGLAGALVIFVALIRRRLQRTEELLDG